MTRSRRCWKVSKEGATLLLGTYAASQRLAEKSRWMTWSSWAELPTKYELIICPMGVVRSMKGHDIRSRSIVADMGLTGESNMLDLPSLVTQCLHESLALCRFACLVQPFECDQ